MFQAANNARRLQIRAQLKNLSMKKAEPGTHDVARASNLEGVEHKPEVTEVKEPVFAGLPQQYDILVTVIPASQVKADLDNVFVILLSEEQTINSCKETVPIYAMRDDRREPIKTPQNSNEP